MSTIEMLLRLGAGIGLGTVIGFERQYRARMAGLRTNALVAVGATLFVLLSANGFSGATADPGWRRRSCPVSVSSVPE